MSEPVHYQYRWDDRSLLLKWLREPLFMPIVRRLPRALTPNQLTLIGHACMWVTAAYAMTAPRTNAAVLLALAFGYAAYDLADIMDGMFARYSGRTSSLGELFDHGLDAVSLGLALLAYGIAMHLPPWLILASTAAAGILTYLTFLHGYRIGFVILGELGSTEGLFIGAIACVVAASGAFDAATRPLAAGVSAAGLLAIAFTVGALLALVWMRGLLHHLADVVPLLIVESAIGVWYAFGSLAVASAGLLMLFTCAYEAMIVTASRLRRVPLRLWDLPLVVMTIAAAVIAVLAPLGAGIDNLAAAVMTGYSIVRGAIHFFRTIAQARRREPGAMPAV